MILRVRLNRVTASEFKKGRCVRLEIAVPSSDSSWDSSVTPFLNHILCIIDLLADLRLSKEVRESEFFFLILMIYAQMSTIPPSARSLLCATTGNCASRRSSRST